MARNLAALLFLVGCGVEGDEVVATHPKAPDALLHAFADATPHSFIVSLPDADRRTRAARLATRELAVEHDWDALPLVQVRAASLEAALATLDRDDVDEAFEIASYALSDAQSFPLIGQPTAAAAGATGAGTAVAVLDTGANYTVADLGGCTAPGQPEGCRVAYAHDFATDDGALDANGHGTNVSAIVAGVAPGTKILALDVFNGESASSTDILSALNWVIANRATYHIAALNLSLGGGSSTTVCTGDAVVTALGSARAAGIAPVVASGNSALTNAISWPACAAAAVSVGAVYDSNVGGLSYSNCTDAATAADKITCFSNSASFLSLLAPGALISAGGVTMAGTSQATPHVAGAFAVLRAAFPDDTVDQALARLASSGKKLTDPRNGVTTPRIDLGAAVLAGASDTAPPMGTVALAGGGATTRTAAVTLAIAASDPSGVAQMCVTNTTTCTAFEAFASPKAWTLAAGNGAKTVTVFLRDGKGNTTSATTSPKFALTLDGTAPVDGTITASPRNGAVALTWTGFSDANTGVASYRVAVATGATAPASCATAIYTGTATAFTHGGIANGTACSYRVCAVDGAGNVSTGAVATATPHELDPPTGTIAINGGAVVTRSLTVTLALSATDASGVTQMCISDATTCTAWVAFATSTTKVLAGDGSRTLRAWFRDKWGNASTTAATATILVDTTAPTNPTLAVTPATGANNLAWSAGTDAGPGIASYRLVGASGTSAPASCAVGTTLYAGTNRQFAHAVASKATWSYRICAIDVAGNLSTGEAKTATAL